MRSLVFIMPSNQGRGAVARQKIIETADLLFYQQGYHATSFTDIAESAGIPRGNFYYYFKSKEEILDHVIEERIRRFNALLAQWSKSLATPKQRFDALFQMLDNEADHVAKYGCPMGTLSAEMAKTSPHLKKLNSKHFVVLKDWLVEQFTDMGLPDDADYLALSMLSRLQGISMIASVFGDACFFRAELKQLNSWIESL